MLTLTRAARELGVDIKTLKRWLARAEMTVEHDPLDDRPRLVADADVADLARIHGVTLRRTLEERIGDLEARVRALEGAERPVSRMVARDIPLALPGRVAPLTRKLSQGNAPSGWIPLPSWCRDHGLAQTTVKTAARDGRFEITREAYQERENPRTKTANWLTPEQLGGIHRAFARTLGDPCRACGWSSMVETVTEEMDEEDDEDEA